MNIYICIFLFCIGLVFIIFGGNMLINNAIKISKITGIPQILIGATIVSIATTLPELCVTVISSMDNLYSIAVGNAIGSIVFNLTFILGICLFFYQQKIRKNGVRKNFYFLFFVMIILFVLGLFNILNRLSGFFLLLVFLAYFISNIIDANKKIIVEEIKMEEVEKGYKQQLIKVFFMFIAGSFFVTFGADLLVNNGARIARICSVSEHIIGVTIIAIGTSLPELVTAITSIRKKSTSIAIGNSLGANILSATLLIGMSGTLNNGTLFFHSNITFVAIPITLLSMLIIYLPIAKKERTFKFQGVLLLAIFVMYYASLFLL